MKERRKKLWSVLLTLALLASLLPVAAVPAAADGDIVTVSTWGKLNEELGKTTNTGKTIQLTSNVSYDGSNPLVVPENVTLTLDLNGHSINATKNNPSAKSAYGIRVWKGNLTIIGTGTISGSTHAGVSVDGGVLELCGNVSINCTGTGGQDFNYHGIRVLNGGVATISKDGNGNSATITGSNDGLKIEDTSSVTMSAGTVTSSAIGVNVFTNVTGAGPHFTMTGGSANGTINGIVVPAGSVSVSANASVSGSVGINATGGTVTVSGGTVTGTATGIKVTAGSAAVSGGTVSAGGTGADSKHAIDVSGGAAASISGTATVTGAFYGVVVTGGASVTMSDYAVVKDCANGVRIEGSGSSFEMTGGALRNNKSGSSGSGVNVANGTAEISGDAEISGSPYGVSVSGGTAAISGGTVAATDTGVRVSAGSAVISGGTISSGGKTGSGIKGIDVSGGAAVTFSGGTVSSAFNGILITGGASVTMSDYAIVKDCANGVRIEGSGSRFEMTGGALRNNKSGSSGSGVNVANGTAEISGDAEISGSPYGVSVSGGSLALEGSAVLTDIAVIGVNVTAGSAEIKDSVEITAPTGVEVSSGTVGISGGTITGVGAAMIDDSITGATGVSVKGTGIASISDGTVSGTTASISSDSISGTLNGTGVKVAGGNDTFGAGALITGGTITGTGENAMGVNAVYHGVTIQNAAISGDAIGVNINGGTVRLSDSTVKNSPVGVALVAGSFQLSGDSFGTGDYANGADVSLAAGQTITLFGELTNQTPISVTAEVTSAAGRVLTGGLVAEGKGNEKSFTSAVEDYLVGLDEDLGEAVMLPGYVKLSENELAFGLKKTAPQTSANLVAYLVAEDTVARPNMKFHDAFEWKLEGDAAAMVGTADGVTVTAAKLGTASITAVGGGNSAACGITVTQVEVSLSATELNLVMGAADPAMLALTVASPMGEPVGGYSLDVEWTTEGGDCFVMEDATGGKLITPKAVGQGKITVTSVESGHSASCTVNVTAAPDPIPSGGISAGGSTATTYPPTVSEAENGTVTVEPKDPAKGDAVTVTLTPAEGYEADTLTVKDADGKDVALTKNTDGTYTYTQPAGKVTVTATFKAKAKETPSESLTVAELMEMFDDLDPNGWYLDDVRYCVENGYMKGMGNNKFGPQLNVSRAMIAQLLWNMAGNPEPTGAAPFGDVAADAWYAKAVAWAYENGITKGTGVGFEPELDITREQLAVMLYNFAKLQGKGFTGLWSFRLEFPDAGDVSKWANEAISWMVMNGIINGTVDETGATILNPKGDATRAQLAAMVHRFCELIAE